MQWTSSRLTSIMRTVGQEHGATSSSVSFPWGRRWSCRGASVEQVVNHLSPNCRLFAAKIGNTLPCFVLLALPEAHLSRRPSIGEALAALADELKETAASTPNFWQLAHLFWRIRGSFFRTAWLSCAFLAVVLTWFVHLLFRASAYRLSRSLYSRLLAGMTVAGSLAFSVTLTPASVVPPGLFPGSPMALHIHHASGGSCGSPAVLFSFFNPRISSLASLVLRSLDPQLGRPGRVGCIIGAAVFARSVGMGSSGQQLML